MLTFIKNAPIIKGITHVSLKYLNFFKLNIFEKINLTINFKNNKLLTHQLYSELKSLQKRKDCINVLQITNGVHIKNQALKLDDDGSLVDITIVSKNVSLVNIDIRKRTGIRKRSSNPCTSGMRN